MPDIPSTENREVALIAVAWNMAMTAKGENDEELFEKTLDRFITAYDVVKNLVEHGAREARTRWETHKPD